MKKIQVLMNIIAGLMTVMLVFEQTPVLSVLADDVTEESEMESEAESEIESETDSDKEDNEETDEIEEKDSVNENSAEEEDSDADENDVDEEDVSDESDDSDDMDEFEDAAQNEEKESYDNYDVIDEEENDSEDESEHKNETIIEDTLDEDDNSSISDNSVDISDDKEDELTDEEIYGWKKNELFNELTDEKWYESYKFEINDADSSIILEWYEGNDTELFVPSRVVVKGKELKVCIGELCYSGASAQSIKFEEGVRFPEDSSDLFSYCRSLKSVDMTGVDTIETTNMSRLFFSCWELERVDLDGIDTSAVMDMSGMFEDCNKLKSIEIKSLDTSNVTNMSGMFLNCTGLTNLDLSGLNTKRVTDISNWVSGCSNLSEIDMNDLNTEKATDMSYMFKGCKGLSNIDVSGFDTGKVTNMSFMFEDCEGLSNIDVSGFDTGKVTNMSYMFKGCKGLSNIDVSRFDTSETTNMSGMFCGCSGLNSIDVSGFDTGKVTNMSYMFKGCKGLSNIDVSRFDTSETTDMSDMFWGCSGLNSIDVSGFNTSKVTSMSGMFSDCTELTEIDVSGFSTSKVTYMSGMFMSCSELTEIDVSGFNTSKVISMRDMFSRCKKLQILNMNDWDTSCLTDASDIFYECNSLEVLGMRNWDFSHISYTSYCAPSLPKIPRSVKEIDVSGWNTTGIVWMDCFRWCENIKSLDLSKWDTSSVSDMSYMFDGCSSLEELKIENWDVSNVGNMQQMFWGCSSLKSLDLNRWNTSNVSNMSSVFSGCSELAEINISNWDTHNVTCMDGLFSNCSSLNKIDITGWNTSKVCSMRGMFEGCKSVLELDISQWDTGQVTDMCEMFEDCIAIKRIDIHGINTSNVTDMEGLFSGCIVVEDINCSDLDTSNVKSMDKMFYRCFALPYIDLSCFDFCSVTNIDNFVSYCTGLEKIELPPEIKCGIYLPANYVNTKSGDVIHSITSNEIDMGNIELIRQDIYFGDIQDVDIPSNEFKICVVDKDTNKIIQAADIYVDGVCNKTSASGYLTLLVDDADITRHSFYAVVDGYCAAPYQMAQIVGGERLILYLERLHSVSYVVGILDGQYLIDDTENKLTIDGVWYDYDADFSADLQGKTVLCTLSDGIIKRIEDINDYFVIKTATSMQDRTFVYQNSVYNHSALPISVDLSTKFSIDGVNLPSDLSGERKITNIEITTSANVEVSQDAWDAGYSDSIVRQVNQRISLDDSYKMTIYVRPKSGYVPDKVLSSEKVRYKVTYENGDKSSFYITINFSNADIVQERAANRNNAAIEEIDLDDNLLCNLSDFKTYYGMTDADVKEMNHLLTVWVANIDVASDTVNEMTDDEYVVNELMKKLGVNLSDANWNTMSNYTATMQVDWDKSPEYGRITFLFTYEGMNFHWDRGIPYSKLGTIRWEVMKSDKSIPANLKSGSVGMFAKANTELFYEQIRDLAMSSIKSAYNSCYGKNLNAVAQQIINKRMLALVDKKFGSTSNMVFTYISKPSQNAANKYKTTRTHCPVDVYIYDCEGNLVGSIVDNVPYTVDDGVVVYMDGESKVVVYCSDDYYIEFVGNGTGAMQHVIEEYGEDGELVRTVTIDGVPLRKGTTYRENMPESLYNDAAVYDLIMEESNSIPITYDSLETNEIVHVESIELNTTTLSLGIDETIELTATLHPDDASVKTVLWESGDESIATVEDGVVTGVSEGTVTITATSVDGLYKAECEVTVSDAANFVLGDVNGDEKVNAADRIYLARYLAGWSGYVLEDAEAADVNDDNKVNAADRIYLARYLAGWSGYAIG